MGTAAALALLPACGGGVAELHDGGESGRDATSPVENPDAGRDAPGAESASGSAAERRTCDGYRAVWARYRVVPASDPCARCFQDTESVPVCPSPNEDPCAASYQCMLRNCTCFAGEQLGECDSTPVPADMCACLDSCLPVGPSLCRQRWLDNMKCVDDKCLSACGG